MQWCKEPTDMMTLVSYQKARMASEKCL